MNFFRKLLGIPEPSHAPRFIPTKDWSGIFASMIASIIANYGMTQLRQTAAFISRTDNGPGLTRMPDGGLPVMTDDPDVLVYCYLKDLPTFVEQAAKLERIIELNATQKGILAKYTTDKEILNQCDGDVLQDTGIDLIAFHLALELEEKVAQLNNRNA